mgnify:CR=1 FL=1
MLSLRSQEYDDDEDLTAIRAMKEKHKEYRRQAGKNPEDSDDEDDDEDEESGFRLGEHSFNKGEYVSISGHDGKMHTFTVVAVSPAG